MNSHLIEHILGITGARSARSIESLQQLWSGYGEILRYQLNDEDNHFVVVKYIHPPSQHNHPRGWNTDLGHQRKLQSYRVESQWYRHYARPCTAPAYVPTCFGIRSTDDAIILVLEDLDACGFPLRSDSVTRQQLLACIRWLACFHARFLGVQTTGLWPIGCYWHLDTRPEEWQKMPPGKLKQAAQAIDRKLCQTRFMTLVHGDAKLENFCFSTDGNRVAAVDFQYVGAGCGMKDLAYFMSSCLTETECENLEQEILDYYFSQLRIALDNTADDKPGHAIDIDQLEQEWRSLYVFAWADFYRFLAGWMPGHWKLHRYSKAMVERALKQLHDG